MLIVSLRDLYIAELRDLYDAEQQALSELPALAMKATSHELREALEDHLEQTRAQLQRLDLIFQQMGLRSGGEPCEAIRGLVAEGRRRFQQCERGDVLDAAIIGAMQRIEHYEIAAYGCVRAYAQALGEANAADLLHQTLQEEGKADHRLSAIAERGVNRSANGGRPAGDPRLRSRLRYIDAGDLHGFPYRAFRVTNDRREDLGALDGFIVESRSGRPLYFVVDSGGWFMGRRYLVPVGMVHADEQARVLRTSLDRETIHRYPEFSPSAFLAMDDEEVHRYEHRLLCTVAPERARTGRSVRPAYEEMPEYRPPTWLMTGVWMTEASGLSAVPPRAESDLDHARHYDQTAPRPVRDESAENELIMARGEPEDRGENAGSTTPTSGEVSARETEQPKTREPRIERYRER